MVSHLLKSANFMFDFIFLVMDYMKVNKDKCHLSLSGQNNLTANIDESVRKSEDILTSPLTNILTIYIKKASAKLNALARILGYMNLPNFIMIMKLFFESQFGYCQLIWMLHNNSKY